MVVSRWQRIIMVLTVGISPTWCVGVTLASDPDAVRDHAEQSFEQLTQRNDHSGLSTSSAGSPRDVELPGDQADHDDDSGDLNEAELIHPSLPA